MLVDDRHVRAGAYALSIEGRLYAVLDRRANSLIRGSEALVEDVATPTRAQRYLDPVEVARTPMRWRACRLGSGEVVDVDAETSAVWVPVGELVGWELVVAPRGMGVASFAAAG